MIKFICVVFALNSVFCIENDLDEPVEQCGIMSASSSLIQGGQRSSAETFPWIASVLTRYQGATLYAGSGSLISDRHVLCAANSVAYENYLDEILNPKQASHKIRYFQGFGSFFNSFSLTEMNSKYL